MFYCFMCWFFLYDVGKDVRVFLARLWLGFAGSVYYLCSELGVGHAGCLAAMYESIATIFMCVSY